MAGAGDLVVRVGIDAAQFTDGLSDAERKAKAFSDSISSGLSSAASVAALSIAAIGTGAMAAFYAVDKLAKQAGEFQDLSEKTGASAEALASFSTAADVAGTDVTTVAQASIILSKNLASSTEESNGAAKAIEALGLNYQDFKNLAPEDQISKVSESLAGFADGAGKTAVAVALFGKSGAQLLPFLKELQQEGGRQVILTAQQIKQADDYADSQAKVASQLQQYAQVAATQALPAITNLTSAIAELAKELTGVEDVGKGLQSDNTIATFAEGAVDALAFVVDAVDGIVRVFKVVGVQVAAAAGALQALSTHDLGLLKSSLLGAAEAQEKILGAEFFSDRVKRLREFNKTYQQFSSAASSFGDDKSNPINFKNTTDPTAPKGNSGQSAIDSATKGFQDQIDKAKELSTVQTVLHDIELNRYNGASAASKARLVELAKEVDAEKTKRDVITSANALALAQEEQLAERDKENEVYRRKNQTAIKDLEDAYSSSLGPIGEYIKSEERLLEIERTLAAAGLLTAERTQQIADVQTFLQQKLKDSVDAANKTADAFDDFAKRARENIQDVLADDLYNAMNGSFSNILTSFKDMINKLIAQAVAADLAKRLFGTSDSKGNSNNDGLIQAGFSAAKSYFGFASGGILPSDRPSLVGERGPEMVMPSSAGMKVSPMQQGGTTIIVNAKDAPSFNRSRGQIASAVTKINSSGLRYS